MFSEIPRRLAPRTRRTPGLRSARPKLENLEGRALMTALSIDFAGTVTAPPVAYKGELYFAA